MSAKYSFSFDRETFEGSYNSRSEAFAAAIKKAGTLEDAPTTVFIGERVPADPQATGHAEDIIARTVLAVRDVLREADTVTQIGDDLLGVDLAGGSRAQLGEVHDRVAAAIASVPLPRRVTANAPRFVPTDSAGRDAA